MGAEQWGLAVGRLPRGPHNRITDVIGVRVGHRTLRDAGVRTGVTVVLPHRGNLFRGKVRAGVAVVGGHTKAAGLEQVRELGTLESPVAITSTLAVGRVLAGLVSLMAGLDPGIGTATDGTVNTVVLECDDSPANDARVPAVGERHTAEAVATASEEVAEGSVGAGAGMTSYGLAAGIGTSSRVVDSGGEWTVGTLVCANMGGAAEARFGGRDVGARLEAALAHRAGPAGGAGHAGGTTAGDGSLAAVVATDAPLDARQLSRLASRGGSGVARTGTAVRHGSGDVLVAFSTHALVPHAPPPGPRPVELLDDTALDPLFSAVADSVEESVYRALLAAEPGPGRPALRDLAAELGLHRPPGGDVGSGREGA